MKPKPPFSMLAAVAALLLVALTSAAQAAAPPQARAATAEQKLAVFDRVFRDVRDLYYDPRFNGADWTAIGARYRPLASAAPDDEALLVVLRSMLGELRDAHTRILTAAQMRDRRAQEALSAGAILFEVEGVAVVYAVVPGSPAAEAGLRPGMRVVAVGGIPVAAALAEARSSIGASSSERAALLLAYRRLVSPPGEQPLRLGLVGADGAAIQVTLPRRRLDARPRFEARLLPGGALYIRFDRFRAPVARQFRAALEQHRSASGLVLDLRANGGGDAEEGMKTVAPLFAAPTLVARLATRTGRPPSALFGLIRFPMELSAGRAGAQLFAGPVVVLVDEGTASTSEIVAASLQERGRARIVGARSCGCALGVLRYRRLPNGAALAISEVGLLSGLGRRIEGEGVVPDVAVPLRLGDLQSGRDAALAAGVRLLADAAGP
jgi:carboxyl-terminal processing protease